MVELNFESFKDFAGDVGSGIKSGIESLGSARYKSDDPILTTSQEEAYLNSIRKVKLDSLKAAYPGTDESELVALAEQEARDDLEKVKKDQLSLFGQMTTPRSLATAGGIIASILAGRESQRRYDDYMASRPKYDPGQNPFMANGGGIQSFADGNEVKPFSKQSLRDMMIMNMKEKPMSAMIKTMTAIDSPEILMALLGMNQGGGIQGFANGTPKFPRMTGDIQGPGTGTSDSIPAMLSDGEHVLTKQEVSQIGGGNNDLGHQKLYAMRQELRSNAKSNGIGRM